MDAFTAINENYIITRSMMTNPEDKTLIKYDSSQNTPSWISHPYSYSHQNGKDNGLLCSEFGFR